MADPRLMEYPHLWDEIYGFLHLDYSIYIYIYVHIPLTNQLLSGMHLQVEVYHRV